MKINIGFQLNGTLKIGNFRINSLGDFQYGKRYEKLKIESNSNHYGFSKLLIEGGVIKAVILINSVGFLKRYTKLVGKRIDDIDLTFTADSG